MKGKPRCKLCEDIPDREKIRSPQELSHFIAFSKKKKKAGEFEETMEKSKYLPDYPIEKLSDSPPWDDIVGHEFICTGCAARFSLGCDTYHGNGTWERKGS
ncbi:hypothetical protein ACWPKS_08575 [Coraliomargarita sp. W4R72]